MNSSAESTTASFLNFYFNVKNIEEYWKFIDWSIDIAQDHISSYQDDFHLRFPIFEEGDEVEAINKYDDARNLYFQQMIVVLFSFFEVFINELIMHIYDKFYIEINSSNLTESSSLLLEHIKNKQEKELRASMEEKLSILKKFIHWKKSDLKKIKRHIQDLKNIRNVIVHNRGKIPKSSENKLPKQVVTEDGYIFIDQNFFKSTISKTIEFAGKINTEVIKKNPELK